MLCPFGCRVENKRRKSSASSKAWYGSPEGKKRKQALNQLRYRIPAQKKRISTPFAADQTSQVRKGSYADFLKHLLQSMGNRYERFRVWFLTFMQRIETVQLAGTGHCCDFTDTS
jgi:hypothetical protein